MWEHYRNTFAGMQIMIGVVTASIYLFFGQSIFVASVFFLVMQLSAVIGAVWAVRLRAYVQRRRSGLPLEPRF
ncbi:hypothetical protein [Humisphaera borealis]|uniref:Uncharacterized protein n=1 Tax=Humisphaera borealis TaxID=2807512 RepID=A0A7M2WTB8_9BACT|nr:hypothetical protein [Humisphaera borealis]QOV88758.1 hypothetical protein IPV69_21390 [Humisphaera borealis]